VDVGDDTGTVQDTGTCDDNSNSCGDNGSGVFFDCACDENQVCKRENGQPCGNGPDCASGNCMAGTCAP
jgi:hypothetical protein